MSDFELDISISLVYCLSRQIELDFRRHIGERQKNGKKNSSQIIKLVGALSLLFRVY